MIDLLDGAVIVLLSLVIVGGLLILTVLGMSVISMMYRIND